MRVLNPKLLTISLAFVALTAAVSLVPNSVHASYDGGNLIDDAVLLNPKTMSASDIQNFLTNMGSGLATKKFLFDCVATDASDPYYRNAGAPCGQNVLASQIIYYASLIYGVNPQAVLATLQKEQSLVTTANPTEWQLDQAMGYGCPTIGGCSASDFLYQIDNGTWVLRLNTERARGNMTWWFTSTAWVCGSSKNFYSPSLMPYQNVKFYDEDGVQYRTHYLLNPATSALYCYTPHAYNNPDGLYGLPAYGTTGRYYSGSYNFVYYFERWFGSTKFPQPIGGMLYRQSSNGKIYLIANDKKFYIPSTAIMENYGINIYKTISVDDTTINAIEDGGRLTNTIRDDLGNVYMVNKGYRHQIPNSTVCTNWAISCFDTNIVKNLGDIFTNVYLKSGTATGSIAYYDGAYYQMLSGERLPFADTATMTGMGFSSSSAINLHSTNLTQPVGKLQLTTPGIIKFSPKTTIYYFNGTSYYTVPDMLAYDSWKLGSVNTINAPISSYNTSDNVIPISSLSYWCASTNGDKYIINNGTKIKLSETQLSLWPDATYIDGLDTLFGRLPSSSLGGFVKSGINFYQLMTTLGEKRYIASMIDYSELGGSSTNTTRLNNVLANNIKNGPFAFANGRLIKVEEDTTIYVVDNGNIMHVASMTVLNAYKFDTSRMKVYPVSSIDEYNKLGQLRMGKLPDNSVVIPYNGRLLRLSESQIISSGLDTLDSINISTSLTNRAEIIQSTQFLRNSDNGSIYYADAGSLHYIGSTTIYYQLGGNTTPTTPVNTSIINMFTIGAPAS